jgi:mannosyltransferase OCH1-like enzyme
MDNDYNTIFIGIIIVIIIIIIYEIAIHINVIEVNTIHEPQLAEINSVSNIPKIIHRTWYSKSLSQKMYDSAYFSWVRLNPDYTMIWNNDNDCEEFMKNVGNEEYDAWKRIIPTAYKADFWRAIKLYETGGVYVDSYAVAVKSIDEIIELSELKNEKDIFISVLDCEQASSGIHNGLLICTPKHPLLKQYINDMLDNIKIGKEDQIMALTGPVCLARSINRYLDRDINTKHQLGLNITDDKKYYLLQFHWGLPGNITINDDIMLYKKYDIIDCWLYQKIYKSLISSNQSYSAMNNAGTVVREF